MASNTFHQASGFIVVHAWHGSSSRCNRQGMFSVRMCSRSLAIRTEIYGARKVNPTRASNAHSLADTHQLPSINKPRCVDVGLTVKGVQEAIEAGKRMSSIPVDVIYTSSLISARTTAAIAMTQHRCKKVPIILHDESEEARAWSKIHSEEARKQSISVITSWQLNERMYGDLQGFSKQEMVEKLGNELVSAPRHGESLEMCSWRAVAYFREHIVPQLQAGKNLLVTAHANALRSIIMYLDDLTAEEVIDLEILTGIPMLYFYKDGKFVRQGVQ